jgi:hypothetical protein
MMKQRGSDIEFRQEIRAKINKYEFAAKEYQE